QAFHFFFFYQFDLFHISLVPSRLRPAGGCRSFSVGSFSMLYRSLLFYINPRSSSIDPLLAGRADARAGGVC
ncbi:MAG: hypothetical protein IJM69_07935, partial [Firmicutes bacterium]|nr:hypothetical protein [Bacillota bacterium]